MSFKLLYDLGPLSNQDREAYLRDIGRHIGLPDNHTLSTIWMDTDGCRNLVPYVRRADAEVLRSIHGIQVLSLTYVIDSQLNQVIFTAIGKDKNGRQEVAIGTHSNEGLKGERLAYSIMTASTRALRRLTLQFVGAGLLDESEVNMHVIENEASQPVATWTPVGPVGFKPTDEPGKDITQNPPKQGVSLQTSADVQPVSSGQQTGATPAFVTGLSVVEPVTQAAIEPKKRTRRKRGTVDIASPGQQIEMPVGNIDNKGLVTPIQVPQAVSPSADISVKSPNADNPETDRIAKLKAQHAADPSAPVFYPEHHTVTLPPNVDVSKIQFMASEPVMPATAPTLGSAIVSSISKEKYDAYRKRLSAYHNDILPIQGKMVNSDGIGGSTMKMRLFCHQVFGTPTAIVEGTKDTKSYTEAEWDELFAFLDSYVLKNGAVGLVEHINKTIGAV